MKSLLLTIAGLGLMFLASCTTTAPVGNVENLERQAPVTQDPNAIGDAINAGNAVNYSNGRSSSRSYGGGFFGW